MSTNPAASGCPADIQIFTFTLMGIKIGVDTEQIAEVLELGAAESRGLPLHRFHELIAFAVRPVVYQAPKALLVRAGESPFLVAIDRPGDIVTIEVGSIQPMPRAVTGGGRHPLWGAVVERDGIMLLFDFLQVTKSLAGKGEERQGGSRPHQHTEGGGNESEADRS